MENKDVKKEVKEVKKNVVQAPRTKEQIFEMQLMTLKIENLQKDLELLELRGVMRIHKNPWDNKLETLRITTHDAYKAAQQGLLLSHLYDANRLPDAHKAIEALLAKYGYRIFTQTITTTLLVLMTNAENKIKAIKIAKEEEFAASKEKAAKDKKESKPAPAKK